MSRTSSVLVGSSRALLGLHQSISQAARSDAKVLITGESGSGKEIVAQMIHRESRRSAAPMVTVNCAALAETLLETELFGHVRGSFTGAYRDRAGVFETADRGTVLLDEVGEMSPRMQGMLLRFLETGEVQRVGADAVHRRVDVRIVAATHRSLRNAVGAQTFREDLFYRLNILQIEVPPLRDHREDIPQLVEHLAAQFTNGDSVHPLRISRDALERLQAYHWPGNVRELRNIVERLASRGLDRPVEIDDLPAEILRETVSPGGPPRGAAPTVADELFERLTKHGESFWSVVYGPFMSRDLTRAELRGVVRRGLTHTLGSYRLMVESFNMPPQDYKKFLSFLHKYQCYMPFQEFRSAAIRMTPADLRLHEDTPRRSGSRPAAVV